MYRGITTTPKEINYKSKLITVKKITQVKNVNEDVKFMSSSEMLSDTLATRT